jgi:hypothetical protein
MPGQLIDINSKLDGLTTRQVMVAPTLCRRPRSSAATAGRPVDTREPVRDSFGTTTRSRFRSQCRRGRMSA